MTITQLRTVSDNPNRQVRVWTCTNCGTDQPCTLRVTDLSGVPSENWFPTGCNFGMEANWIERITKGNKRWTN